MSINLEQKKTGTHTKHKNTTDVCGAARTAMHYPDVPNRHHRVLFKMCKIFTPSTSLFFLRESNQDSSLYRIAH